MSRLILLCVAALALLLTIAGWRWVRSSSPEALFEPKTKPIQAAPLCPWREPEADLKLFFPDAARYEVETRILSGQRVELAERLGRAPSGDENALHVYRIYGNAIAVGSVLTCRVKGEHGAIELVLAVDPDEKVRGLRLQRLREPDAIARALQAPEWLHSFEGRRADSSWKGGEVPEVPVEARASAEAVAEGVRSLLILLSASQTNLPHTTVPHR